MPAHKAGKHDRKWNHVGHHKGRVGRHTFYRNHFVRDKNKKRKLTRHIAEHPNDNCAAVALRKI